MSWRWDYQHIAFSGERHALLKRTQSPIVKVNKLRLPSLRPSMRQVPLNSSAPPARSLQFSLRDPELASRQVNQSAGMIRVEVCQYNLLHVSRAYAETSQLETDFLIWMN